MKYIKRFIEHNSLNEGLYGAENDLEEAILKRSGYTLNSTIIRKKLYPMDKDVESYEIDGVELLSRYNDNGSVEYDIVDDK